MAFNGTEATGGRWVYPNLWCGLPSLLEWVGPETEC
jgi:hypothetical protein